jgi:Lar family restriction alleviation protein
MRGLPDPQTCPGQSAMSTETTLRPCPFCGSTQVSVSTCRRGNAQERYVECEACEAMAGSWPIGEASFERASELAVRKWNRRSGL